MAVEKMLNQRKLNTCTIRTSYRNIHRVVGIRAIKNEDVLVEEWAKTKDVKSVGEYCSEEQNVRRRTITVVLLTQTESEIAVIQNPSL